MLLGAQVGPNNSSKTLKRINELLKTLRLRCVQGLLKYILNTRQDGSQRNGKVSKAKIPNKNPQAENKNSSVLQTKTNTVLNSLASNTKQNKLTK